MELFAGQRRQVFQNQAGDFMKDVTSIGQYYSVSIFMPRQWRSI